MTIDQFTKETFETYLEDHKPLEPLGLVDDEYCYRIILDGQASIMLRSSIKAGGQAADTGQDSIRLWLVGNDNKPLGSKLDSWTTRVSGWQRRLNAKIYELAKRRANAGDCHCCGKPFGIYKNRKSGELFVKCWPCSDRLKKRVMGNLNNKGRFAPASQMGAGVIDDGFQHQSKGEQNDDNVLQTPLLNDKKVAHTEQSEKGAVLQLGNNTTQHKLPNNVNNETEQCEIMGKGGLSLQKLPEKVPENNGLNEFLENPFGDDEPQPEQSKKPKSNIPTCPKCNDTMILRSGPHFDDFWGCRNFPKCRETVNIPKPKIEIKSFKPSHYQKAIFDFVKNGNGHGVVNGVAGCGKTTTNVQALQLVPKSAKIKYAAFNNHIERDISRKSPEHVDVSTFHKWGKANIIRAYPDVKINKWKVYNIIDDMSPKIDRDLKEDIVKAISLLKGSMLEPTQDNILAVVDNFDLDIVENDTSFIRQVFLNSIVSTEEIDLNDMVYYPASGIVKCSKFDYIFVDEMQDMNTAQYVLSKKSLADDGRFFGIGDPNQSIYAFRGAFVGIMDFMANEMDATKLPLSISYRAPLAIVKLVNEQYPHIKFEASKTAKNGLVGQIGYDDFIGKVDQNSGVLCRTNAPLVTPCFELIRNGVKANILGRDIGTGLIKLIEKREKLQRARDLDSLLEQVRIYCSNEANKARARDKLSRVALLEDQEATIHALSDGCKTIRELKEKTTNVFSNQAGGVTFSTIHKAKGLEWEKVFVIGPKSNHPMGDAAQETNIRYVRDTRTLNELYYVEDE